MRQNKLLKTEDSFTLVELLVVIGILAILTAAVVIVLNPAELLRQSRDSKRTTDLANLNNAIKLLLTQNPDVNLGAASTVYVSLADSSSTCGSYALPTLPTGWKYQCATAVNYQKTDGSGWVPVNFSSTNGVASLPALPADPQNTVRNYYSYISGGSWQLVTVFESSKYAAKEASDGGSDLAAYEVGSNLSLAPFVGGMVGYWPFDEGSGSSAFDRSGNNNTGSIANAAWQPKANCRTGSCLSFSTSSQYVSIGAGASALKQQFAQMTISAWVYPMALGGGGYGPTVISNTESDGWALRINNGYLLADLRLSGGNVTQTIGSVQVPLNAWSLVAISYDGSSIKGYINDQNIGSVAGSGTVRNGGNSGACTAIGNEPYICSIPQDVEFPFPGSIDDVRVYNRALSAAEIQAIYNATK